MPNLSHGSYDGFLDVPDVPAHVVVFQQEDGVTHELARAVVRGVTSPLDLKDRDVLGPEVLRATSFSLA